MQAFEKPLSPNQTFPKYVVGGKVCDTHLLLQSFTGIPSIFDLMTLLLFLIAERTASRRNPGHLSSFRISLHTKTEIILKWQIKMNGASQDHTMW